MDVVFPAHAGVIRRPPMAFSSIRCFPRTRGGDPTTRKRALSPLLFSPHTRG